MIQVDNFLGCAKLETGGLIIGWFTLVSDVIFLVFSVIAFIVLCAFGCDDMERILVQNNYAIEADFREICGLGRGIVIAILVFFIVLASLFIYWAWLLIKGSKNRNHSQVKPMMIVMAISAILSFLNILSFTAHGLVSGVVYGVIYGYAFVVLHSLYTMFRDETERGYNPQYHAPGGAKV